MVNNEYDAQFEAAGQHYDVDPKLLKTIFHVESAGNPKAPRGSSGEIGSFQLMPKTAQMLNVQDPTDMNQAIPAAAQYLRQGLDANNGDAVSAVRYYNGGPNGVNNPATMTYAQKAANLYSKMGLQKPTTTKSQEVDPDIALGESIVSGKAPSQSAPPSVDPDIALGESIVKQSMSNGSTAKESASNQTSDNTNQPTTGENILAGAVHGISSVGHTIGTGLNKLASYADEKIPALGRLDQNYGIDPKANLAASNDIEQAYNKRYGDSTAASIANFGGQLVGTLPFTAGVGAVGGMAAKGVANSISNPLLSATMHGVGDIATGAAQGGVAAGLTGGNPLTGAIAGGGIGAAGLGVGGALTSALSSSNPRVVGAISDQIVKLLAKGVGAHFGGIPGYLVGEAAGPVINDIAKRYGSGMAMRAAQALNSTGASTAAGIVGGKVNELERQ